MAKLPAEVTATINTLKQQALDIIVEASALESNLFEAFGETEATISYLDEMKNVADYAESSYSQLSTLQLQIVKLNPRWRNISANNNCSECGDRLIARCQVLQRVNGELLTLRVNSLQTNLAIGVANRLQWSD